MYHFIISARSSTDRRDLIIKQFKKLNLPNPNFFDAIMGNTLSEKELKKNLDSFCTLNPGEIGCTLSHLTIYQKFLTTNEPSLFVFEDDILLSDDVTLDFLLSAKHFIDTQAEPAVLLLRPARFMLNKVKDIDDRFSIMSVKEISSTYAYIINRKAAQNILHLQTPIKFIIDGWRYYTLLNTLKAYCLNDYIIKHNFEFPSIISSINGSYTRTNRKKEREALKKIIAALPIEEQRRIKKEKIIRTFERLKCILSGRKDMNLYPKGKW